jgi:hypothetical protein
MGLKNRLNKYSVNKQAVEKALSDDSGRKEDNRILRVSKLDADKKESMRGLIMIDPNGELIHKFSKVGPRAKVDVEKNGKKSKQAIRGIEHIGVPADSVIAQQKIDWYIENKDRADDDLKKLANCINDQTYYLVNFLPLECPFTIPESEDGNLVKLVYLPSDVFVEIQKQIENGEMTIEDLANYPINIKRTKGDNGFATYEQSSVSRKPLSEEEESQFEDDDIIEPYALSELDIVPEIPTEEQEQAWLEKYIPIIKKALGWEVEGGDDAGDTSEEKKTESKLSKSSLQDRLASKPKEESQPEPEPEPEQEEQAEESQPEQEEQPQPEEKKPALDLKSRLRQMNSK